MEKLAFHDSNQTPNPTSLHLSPAVIPAEVGFSVTELCGLDRLSLCRGGKCGLMASMELSFTAISRKHFEPRWALCRQYRCEVFLLWSASEMTLVHKNNYFILFMSHKCWGRTLSEQNKGSSVSGGESSSACWVQG